MSKLVNKVVGNLKMPAVAAAVGLAGASLTSCGTSYSRAGVGTLGSDGKFHYAQQPAEAMVEACGDAEMRTVYGVNRNGHLAVAGAEVRKLAPSETYRNITSGTGQLLQGAGALTLGIRYQPDKINVQGSSASASANAAGGAGGNATATSNSSANATSSSGGQGDTLTVPCN